MIFKSIKVLVISGVALVGIGALIFGGEGFSYLRSGWRSAQAAAKEAIPTEFELKRARDMLDDIVPEMQANIRQIAQQEVEIGALKEELAGGQKSLAEESKRITAVRNCLSNTQVSYTLSGRTYSREQLAEDLARRFDRYKEAEVVLAGKKRLMENREKSLAAAMQMLDRTRHQKAMLESQVEAMESQFRLVQAASVGSSTSMDQSKLADAQKVIEQIRKQLNVAERVLAHEARFTEPVEINVLDEQKLMAAVDEHFAAKTPAVAQSSGQ